MTGKHFAEFEKVKEGDKFLCVDAKTSLFTKGKIHTVNERGEIIDNTDEGRPDSSSLFIPAPVLYNGAYVETMDGRTFGPIEMRAPMLYFWNDGENQWSQYGVPVKFDGADKFDGLRVVKVFSPTQLVLDQLDSTGMPASRDPVPFKELPDAEKMDLLEWVYVKGNEVESKGTNGGNWIKSRRINYRNRIYRKVVEPVYVTGRVQLGTDGEPDFSTWVEVE